MEFKNKFIGFVDILGFKDLVRKAEREEGMNLADLLDIVTKLGDKKDIEIFSKYGPIICPESKYIEKCLDFQILQVSDCVIISAEVSPAGVINILFRFWSIAMGLMLKGILCRGYITRGLLYQTENQVIGSGYQEAFAGESAVAAFKRNADERGTPFIEIDAKVTKYIHESGDRCINEMYGRFVKSDGTVTAIFPFERLSHSFAITGNFDPDKEKQSNNNIRNIILATKDRILNYVDQQNQQAMTKVEHYLGALDEQLNVCHKTDEFIDSLKRPFPFRTI